MCVQVSVENAVAVTHTLQTPLLIDPGARALAWLCARERSGAAAVEVTAMHEARFATALELAVRFGKVRTVSHARPCKHCGGGAARHARAACDEPSGAGQPNPLAGADERHSSPARRCSS